MAGKKVIRTFVFHFGAMAEPIKQQLASQGFKPKNKSDIGHWQKDTDAITRAYIRGLLTERETGKARDRLSREIMKGVH
jgi:hypothetical protein